MLIAWAATECMLIAWAATECMLIAWAAADCDLYQHLEMDMHLDLQQAKHLRREDAGRLRAVLSPLPWRRPTCE